MVLQVSFSDGTENDHDITSWAQFKSLISGLDPGEGTSAELTDNDGELLWELGDDWYRRPVTIHWADGGIYFTTLSRAITLEKVFYGVSDRVMELGPDDEGNAPGDVRYEFHPFE